MAFFFQDIQSLEGLHLMKRKISQFDKVVSWKTQSEDYQV